MQVGSNFHSKKKKNIKVLLVRFIANIYIYIYIYISLKTTQITNKKYFD